jgi:uncharacterized membrane protein
VPSLNGQPLSGATVSLSNGMSATTDAEGNYSFADVAPGSYTITVVKDGYQNRTASVSVGAGDTTAADTPRGSGAPFGPLSITYWKPL